MNLDAIIESILFASARAMTLKQLAQIADAKLEDVRAAVEDLSKRLTESGSALQVILQGQEAELVTRPEVAEIVRATIKEEAQGELTKPSLEALAILAYRGPLTRPELEQIRGVQSALILRNLMMRGLVETREDARLGQPVYAVTLDFLKALGVDRVETLPDFTSLRAHRAVEQVLQELNAEVEKPVGVSDPTLSV